MKASASNFYMLPAKLSIFKVNVFRQRNDCIYSKIQILITESLLPIISPQSDMKSNIVLFKQKRKKLSQLCASFNDSPPSELEL